MNVGEANYQIVEVKSYVFSTHFNIILPSIPMLFVLNIGAQIGTRETLLSSRLCK